MIVLHSAKAAEQHLRRAIRFVVAIGIREDHDFGRTRDNDLVAEHANPEGRVDFWALIKRLGDVGGTVTVGVFEYDDAIAVRTGVAPTPVIGSLRDPDPSSRIDLHVGRVDDLRFRREEGDFQPLWNGHRCELFPRGRRTGPG